MDYVYADEGFATVLIRPAETGDLQGVYRCIAQMASYKPAVDSHNLIAQRFFGQEWVYAVVAVNEASHSQGQIIGFASISFEMKIRGGVIGHVEDVVVDNPWRGRGVGRALLSSLRGEALRRNAYQIFLECSEVNIGFYESCGLVRSGVSMSWSLR